MTVDTLHFTPWLGLGGGVLIGLASLLLMRANGRIAGISGILGGLLPPIKGDNAWRAAFIAGLLIGGGAWVLAGGDTGAIRIEASMPVLAGAGLLVGFGTRLGHGCTSGHGVCGIGRISPRGIVATLVFVGTAAITVYVTHHVIGGAS